MGVKRIDPQRAKELLDSGKGYIYLDVRMVPEFEEGHVPGAENIPVMVKGPGGAGIRLNDSFLEAVGNRFDLSAKIILGCNKGGRSQKAAVLLSRAGYTNLHEMRGGFLGETDPFGNVTFPGWSSHGLPVSTGEQAGAG
ncbi:MAG: rhodanese-like domain-containing protein [Planctomycetota bacterium]